MTVGQLADQLGITLKEAVALCVVTGVQVTGAHTELTPNQVAAVRDVLEGRVQLPDPKTRALGQRSRAYTPLGAVLAIGAAVLILLGLVGGGLLYAGTRGDPTVLRALPGDCFNADLFFQSVVPASVEVVPCSGPHQFEAFGTIDFDDVFDEYPGAEKIRGYAEDRCPALAGAAGADRYTILFLGPGDAGAWEDPSTHKIICANKAGRNRSAR